MPKANLTRINKDPSLKMQLLQVDDTRLIYDCSDDCTQK